MRASVELSLQRMRTDHIDVLHLHSCDKEDLLDGSLADTMQELKDEGKTNEYYEGAYLRLIRRGDVRFGVVDVHACMVTEIDNIDDLARADALVRAREA